MTAVSFITRHRLLLCFFAFNLVFAIVFGALSIDLHNFHSRCADSVNVATIVFGSLAGYFLLSTFLAILFTFVQHCSASSPSHEVPLAAGVIALLSTLSIILTTTAGVIALFQLVFKSNLSHIFESKSGTVDLCFKEIFFILLAFLVIAIFSYIGFMYASIRVAFKQKKAQRLSDTKPIDNEP